ncbi:ABC transporter ATP-binding protein [Propionibacteriaceae bacterium Y2011]
MITFDALTKQYGEQLALDHVSFTVPAGTVTGFLGPNGAGKSTAMRILLGLATATSGAATIAGRRYVQWPSPARVAGSMLDADAFHPGRTGRESLTLACLTLGLPSSRVDEVLELVGLTTREGRRRVRTYSLGMRQRLGIAQALLTDPSVLVLDEPANGLDPQGQRWLGDLLRDRAERGCAVLLSSHQLSEVERLADRLVVIAAGRIVADDTLARLQAAHGDITDFYFEVTSAHDRAAA